ncbi:MAG: lamin tail domain-containing protein [Clostridia bacterium]|nr:lamin tail domain-containing protein [Clostridia bacterium]
MQYNTPPQRTTRSDAATPVSRRQAKDYKPRRKKNRSLGVLPLMILFVALLVVMYLIFPKEAGRHVGGSYYDGLVISEVMAANNSAVPDENGEFSDWLELYNGSGHDIEMEGVMLTNRTDRITFPFPKYTLRAGERVIVFASDSYQLDPSLPFHGKFKISSAGDHIYLYDPEMYLIDELATPTLIADSSYILSSVDEDGVRHYETTTFYSPEYENSEEGFVAYRTANAIESGDLVINEVCPDPRLSIPDEDGEIVDWIELKNNTNETISLTGYYLSDKENKPMKWRFPDGASIPPGGYYLVYCSSKDKMQLNGIPHTSFSLSAERESVVLSDDRGRLIDRVSIENVPEDYSYGRSDVGDWRLFQLTSPGQANNAAGQAQAEQIYRAYNYTGVLISEVGASNDTIVLGPTGATTDYIELYNSSAETVYLQGYGLSDSLKRPRRWQFPENAYILPGEYKIIYLDAQPELTTVTDYHTNFKLTRDGGETISFCDPTGRVLDRMPLSLIPTDHSYGRTLGQNGFYYYDIPTPGMANGTGYYGYTKNPAFSLPGGEYKDTIQVAISVPEGSEVYYTTDGSIPTRENATRYSAGQMLDITRVTVLRARAFDLGGTLQPSETITQTYLMNLYHAFPVVSLVADPYELWNEENGMLSIGGEIPEDAKIRFKLTTGEYPNYREYGKEERPGHIEYYGSDGTTILSQDCEFGLQGQYSLDIPQKTFKVRAKAKYGEKYFNAKLFDDLEFTEYKCFVLRMGGNDGVWTRMNDAFQSQLIKRFNTITDTPSTVIYQDWKPVVVYLNGVYWGHYNLRERVDRFFVAQHEGLSLDEADNMDLLEASGTVNFGSNAEYRAMIKKVEASSPGTNEEDLQYILDNVDVDNYFDYMAFEMFFGNSDPGNIRFYKLKQEDAKWRWIFYDSDYGLFNSSFNSPKSYLKPSGAGDQKINNTLIRKLLENDEMRHKFLTRLGEIFQVFTTEFMTELYNEMAAVLEPEMPLHFARWAEENDRRINFDSPLTPEGALSYWNKRLNFTRNVIKKRPTYLYEMIQEQFQLTDGQMVIYFGEKPEMPADAIL